MAGIREIAAAGFELLAFKFRRTVQPNGFQSRVPKNLSGLDLRGSQQYGGNICVIMDRNGHFKAQGRCRRVLSKGKIGRSQERQYDASPEYSVHSVTSMATPTLLSPGRYLNAPAVPS
jgi:hypothetical protein